MTRKPRLLSDLPTEDVATLAVHGSEKAKADALYTLRWNARWAAIRQLPNPTGRTQSGARVYSDNSGIMASGYTLVHWDDAKALPWCQNNGYYGRLPESESPIVWDEPDDRTKRLKALIEELR